MNDDFSFTIPLGFRVILRESSAPEAREHWIIGGGTDCQTLEEMDWMPTPESLIWFDEGWMVEFFESDDCTGSSLELHF